MISDVRKVLKLILDNKQKITMGEYHKVTLSNYMLNNFSLHIKDLKDREEVSLHDISWDDIMDLSESWKISDLKPPKNKS